MIALTSLVVPQAAAAIQPLSVVQDENATQQSEEAATAPEEVPVSENTETPEVPVAPEPELAPVEAPEAPDTDQGEAESEVEREATVVPHLPTPKPATTPEVPALLAAQSGELDVTTRAARLQGKVITYNNSTYHPMLADWAHDGSMHPMINPAIGSSSLATATANGVDAVWSLPAVGDTGKIVKVGGSYSGWCMSVRFLPLKTGSYNNVYMDSPENCAGTSQAQQFRHESYGTQGRWSVIRHPSKLGSALAFPSVLEPIPEPILEFFGHLSPGGFLIRADALAPVTPPTPVVPVPNVSKSALEVTNGTRLANNSETHEATATIRDNDNAIMSGQTVNFRLFNESGTTPITNSAIATIEGSAVTGASGTAVAKIKATEPGIYTVEATIGGKHISGSMIKQVRFVSPPVSKVNELVVSTGERFADKFDFHTATAYVYDATGAPVAGQTVNFEIWNSVAAVSTAVSWLEKKSAVTDSNGVATSKIWAAKKGTFRVKATTQVNGVETALKNSMASVVFVDPPGVNLEQSVLTVSPGTREANGIDTHQATVTVKSGQTATVVGEPVSFAVYRLDGTPTTDVKVEDAVVTSIAGGIATTNITATVPGKYMVEAKIRGAHANYSRARTVEFVTVTVPNPDENELVVSLGQRFADGKDAHTATVSVRNAAGEPISGRGVVLSVVAADGTATNNAKITPELGSTGSTGLLEAKITASVAGFYRVQATIGGVHVTDSPSPLIEFVDRPTVSVEKSWLDVSTGPRSVNPAETHEATATILDMNGTAMAGQVVKFSVLTEGGALTNDARMVEAEVTSLAGTGQAVAKISATKAGRYMVTATVAGQHIRDSGKKWVTFVSIPTVSPGLSYLDVSTGTRWADEEKTHEAIATIRDTDGAPMPSQPVTFSVFAEDGTGTQDAKLKQEVVASDLVTGKATASIVATKPGTYMVKATVAGEHIKDSGNKWVTFVTTPVTGEISADHTVVPGNVLLGEQVTYEVTFTNGLSVPTKNAIVKFKLPADMKFVRAESANLYSADTSNWYPRIVPAGGTRVLKIIAEPLRTGVFTSKVASVTDSELGRASCEAGVGAACGAERTVTVTSPVAIDMTCPVPESQDGIIALAGTSIPADATRVFVYVREGSGAATKFGEATIAGVGSARTWSFTNSTPLDTGNYSFTVRSVTAAGLESADSDPSCQVAVFIPAKTTGTKVVAPVEGASPWVTVVGANNWEITATDGAHTQVMSGAASAMLVPGVTYTIGERLRTSPAPVAETSAHTQQGTTLCVDKDGVELPSTVFDSSASTITLDASGKTRVKAPISCTITNQAAHVEFVAKRVGGQTAAPEKGWALAFENASPTANVKLDSSNYVRAARTGSYVLTAEAPVGFTVTSIERLQLGSPGCQAVVNSVQTAPELCWIKVTDGATVASENVPQGKHSVFRVVAEYGLEAPPLPMTGGVGEQQFLLSGAGVLLIASVAYWRRSRRLSVITPHTNR